MKWYQIDTGYACGGIAVQGNKIVKAPPIFRWMIGQGWSRIQHWRKIKSITPIED